MLILTTLWWLCFWTAAGLCLGSFLNVVIFRLPRGQSLRDPLWSACPHCRHRIEWYDNLPLVSFILLQGRCRHCHIPIATRYPVIEALTALVVLMLVDAFFVSGVRVGLCGQRFGLTEQLAYDWPILLAHVILFACLLSMSAIDLEHYWVDVRFTNLATLAAFVLHALWTPKHSIDWPRPLDATAVMSLFAVVGLGVVWLVLVCQPHADPEDYGESESLPEASSGAPFEGEPQCRTRRNIAALYEPRSRAMGWACGLMLLGLFVSMAFSGFGWTTLRHSARALPPLLLAFILIVRESTVSRESDQHIVDAIHEERHGARAMVLTELVMLLPAALFAWVGFQLMSGGGELADRMSHALHSPTHVGGISMMRSWTPLYGLATAASGYVIAGALGWTVRIFFTLVFGKEAFGTGDIHLMAATGAIAGWPVVVLGFMLACGVALLGWVIALPFKRPRALPLGPWLSISFLTVVIFYEQALKIPIVAKAIVLVDMLFLKNSQV